MSAAVAARTPTQATRERALTKVFDTIEESEGLAGWVRRSRDEVSQLFDCDDGADFR